MNCPFYYIVSYYGVPACLGRRVEVYGEPGVIAGAHNQYLRVNLDTDKPGVTHIYHPTDGVTYLGMGTVRKPSPGRARYQRWLEYGDGFDSFIQFCRWDAVNQRAGGAML